jgi:YggT family protein
MRSHLIETDDGVLVRERDVSSRSLVVVRIGRIIDYLFGLLYALLLVRLALEFFGARSGTGFVKLVDDLTDVFYAPFKGIFPTTALEAGHLVWPLVVAIFVYMLLHAAIRGLLSLVART